MDKATFRARVLVSSFLSVPAQRDLFTMVVLMITFLIQKTGRKCNCISNCFKNGAEKLNRNIGMYLFCGRQHVEAKVQGVQWIFLFKKLASASIRVTKENKKNYSVEAKFQAD